MKYLEPVAKAGYFCTGLAILKMAQPSIFVFHFFLHDKSTKYDIL
jgi:hypothetical protein